MSDIFCRKTKKDNLSRVYLEVSDTLPLVHLRRVVFSRSRAGFCIFFRSSSFPEQPAACGCDCQWSGNSKAFLKRNFACWQRRPLHESSSRSRGNRPYLRIVNPMQSIWNIILSQKSPHHPPALSKHLSIRAKVYSSKLQIVSSLWCTYIRPHIQSSVNHDR